jgi:hypothetical protein
MTPSLFRGVPSRLRPRSGAGVNPVAATGLPLRFSVDVDQTQTLGVLRAFRSSVTTLARCGSLDYVAPVGTWCSENAIIYGIGASRFTNPAIMASRLTSVRAYNERFVPVRRRRVSRPVSAGPGRSPRHNRERAKVAANCRLHQRRLRPPSASLFRLWAEANNRRSTRSIHLPFSGVAHSTGGTCMKGLYVCCTAMAARVRRRRREACRDRGRQVTREIWNWRSRTAKRLLRAGDVTCGQPAGTCRTCP